MSEKARPTTVVQAWQEAANARDIARLLALSDENIEVVGPRGAGHGHGLLREWLARAGLHLDPLRVFGRGDTVVVEQRAVWRSIETGDLAGQQDVASVFVVAGDRVARLARYGSLAEALQAAGLSDSDQLTSA
jgi:hypothetical protein